MTKVDQFESMFRSASREVYQYERAPIASVLVVTDLEDADTEEFVAGLRRFLSVIDVDSSVQWRSVAGSEAPTPGDLLALVEAEAPDLVCTYRNLHSAAWRWPYSLGSHVDLLTQHTSAPVMLVPHPKADRSAAHALENTDVVMAITDHLAGDQRLVNYAVRFAETNATLWLTHVEDEVTFERYMEVISKIPSINTDEARESISQQLLKAPADYITGCAAALEKAGAHIRIKQLIAFGHHLSEYKRLIEDHNVDLLVMNTKDHDQIAMHGIAYALAVELRHIPLLML